jgi:hypothetical protein
MKAVSVALAAAGLAVLCGAANAETITSRVVQWDAVKNALVLADKSVIYVDPKLVPADAQGQRVQITFEGAEGIDKITEVKIVE